MISVKMLLVSAWVKLALGKCGYASTFRGDSSGGRELTENKLH